MAADNKNGVVYECEHKRDEICRENDSMYLISELKCKKCVYGTSVYPCEICERSFVMVEGFYSLNICILKDKEGLDHIVCAGCLRGNHLMGHGPINMLLLDLNVKARGGLKERVRKQLTEILVKIIEYNKFKKDLFDCKEKAAVIRLLNLLFGSTMTLSDIMFIVDNLNEQQLTTLFLISSSYDPCHNTPSPTAAVLFCLTGFDMGEIRKKYSFL